MMIESRGYNIKSEKDGEINTNECVFIYSGNNKVNINYIKNIMKYVSENNFNHVILIYKDNITSHHVKG